MNSSISSTPSGTRRSDTKQKVNIIEWPVWLKRAEGRRQSFAVLGLGRFGRAVCNALGRAGVSDQLLVIDANKELVEKIAEKFLNDYQLNIQTGIVDCTVEEALRQAGALDMDTVVVAMGEPMEVSLTATYLAKHGNSSEVKKVIARASSELHKKMLKAIGADKVVFPSQEQGYQLGEQLVRPNLLERLQVDDKNSIEEIEVPKAFVGRSIRDLNLRNAYGVTVLAAGAKDKGQQLMVNPGAEMVLSRGDLLVVMGDSESLKRIPQN